MQVSGVSTIMVQIGEPKWTLAALHLACAVARTNGHELILVKMIPVSHVGWLGTEFGYRNFTETDRRLLKEYGATAEDYGIASSVELYQYVILSDAIVDAAEYVNARFIFATLPQYKLPFWRRFLLWRLHSKLKRQGRLLYVLDEPLLEETWVPHIVVPAITSPEKAH
jgi:hypothetical protein